MSLRDIFSNWITFTVINKYVKGAVVQLSTLFSPVTMLLFEGSSETGIFRTGIYFTTYFRFCDIRNTSAMRSIFSWKYSKFNQAFKNAETNFFFFWNNCIWIGYLKFSVLKRGYLSSAINMLTNIFKTLHITMRYFLQLNWLHSEQ